MISVPLRLSIKHQCGYFDDRMAQSLLTDPAFPLNTEIYSRLIEQGYRRSGDQVYKPACQSCLECVPTRIEVGSFQPDRKQRRCRTRNSVTSVLIKPAVFDARHFDLYQRYQAARHDKQAIDAISEDDYLNFLTSTWCETRFVEFCIAGRLAAVAVIDVLDNALSAVYTFFEPEFADYSPGVFAVLWQIEHAGLTGLEYVYLGFWLKNCRKMRYKSQYQPLQGLIDQQWQIISNQHQ